MNENEFRYKMGEQTEKRKKATNITISLANAKKLWKKFSNWLKGE